MTEGGLTKFPSFPILMPVLGPIMDTIEWRGMLAALRRRCRGLALFMLLAFSLGLFGTSPVHAARPESIDAAFDQVSEINEKTIKKVHSGFTRVIGGLVERLNRRDGFDLQLRSNFADTHGRVFCHLVGKVILHVPLCSEKKASELDEAAGYRLTTDGPLSVDFAIIKSERVGERRWALDIDFSLVVIVKDFLRQLVRNGASFLGTVTLSLCAGRVIEMLQNLDLELVGEGMAKGLNGVAGLLAGNSAGQAYETIANFEGKAFLESLKKNFSHRSVMYAFAAGLVAVGIHSGLAVVGTTLGATLGTMVCPGIGTSLGAALGAVIFGLIGNVVVNFVTSTMPFKYTLWRIRRYHAWGWEERHGEVCEHLIDTIRLEIETDRYQKLNMLIKRLEGEHAEGRDLAPYQSLIQRILDLLRYSMLADQNWHGARKYYQMLAAIGRLPHQGGEEGAEE